MLEERTTRIFTVVMLVAMIVVIVMAVLGGICYDRNGWYPQWKDTFTVLSGSTKDCMHLKDSFNFMADSGINAVPDLVMIFSAFVLGSIYNLDESPLRGIVGLVIVGGFTGFIVYGTIKHISPDFSLVSPMVIGISSLAFILLLFLCFKSTGGGYMVLIGIAGCLVKDLLIPIIMWFAFLSTAGKIGAVIAAVVFVILMTTNVGGAIFESSGKPAPAAPAVDRARQKKLDRIAVLENKIKVEGDSIKAHNQGRFGYGYVDTKYTGKVMDDQLKEVDMLKKSLS